MILRNLPSRTTAAYLMLFSLLALVLACCVSTCDAVHHTPVVAAKDSVSVIETHDTVIRVLQPAPVTIRELHTHIVYRDRAIVSQIDSTSGTLDTVLRAEPFYAVVDTTVQNIGVSAAIAFPPLRFASLDLQLPADTSREVRTSQNIAAIRTEIITESPPWYEEAGKSLLFLAVGTGIGYILAN